MSKGLKIMSRSDQSRYVAFCTVMCILFYYWIQVDDKLFIHLFEPVCNVYFILLLDAGG